MSTGRTGRDSRPLTYLDPQQIPAALMEPAMEAGQPPSPALADLRQVRAYITDDGRVWHPSQVTLIYDG